MLLAAAVTLGVLVADPAKDMMSVQGSAHRFYKVPVLGTIYPIYNGELYTLRKLSYEEIMAGANPCALKLTYLRNIGTNDYRPKWAKRLKELEAPQQSVEAVTARLPGSVEMGATLEFEWTPRVGLGITYKGQRKEPLNDRRAFEAVFKSFLGPDAPEGVADGLLGTAPAKAPRIQK